VSAYRRIIGSSLISILLGLAAVGCQESDPGSLRAIMGDDFAPSLAANPCIRAEDAERLTTQMLERVNQERRKRHLTALRRNDTLDRIADFYACRLIDGGFFSHVDPYDDSRIDTRAGDFGYAYRKIGENLGAGQISVDQVFRDWMRSEGHRDNILDSDFTEIGLAVRLGGTHGVYWVQEFGRPLTTMIQVDGDESDAQSGGEEAPPESAAPASRPAAQADDSFTDDADESAYAVAD